MAARKKRKKAPTQQMLFSSQNYKLLVLGIALIIVGFTAMYIENEVEGFISLFISPIVIMAGYVVVIFAIMKRDGSNSSKSQTVTS